MSPSRLQVVSKQGSSEPHLEPIWAPIKIQRRTKMETAIQGDGQYNFQVKHCIEVRHRGSHKVAVMREYYLVKANTALPMSVFAATPMLIGGKHVQENDI